MTIINTHPYIYPLVGPTKTCGPPFPPDINGSPHRVSSITAK